MSGKVIEEPVEPTDSDPTPEEIWLATKRIRETWSSRERMKRAGVKPDAVDMHETTLNMTRPK